MIDSSQKFLLFRIDQEEHGVPLMSVREVSSQREVRPVPGVPPHFLGVTNLRGSVVSVISLAIKLGITDKHSDTARAMLVFDLAGTTMGVFVDEVLSVRAIPAADIDRETHAALPIPSRFISGIAKVDDRLVTLLDLVALLDGDLARAS
jgi:purine-binding chemotaxis protein CheW